MHLVVSVRPSVYLFVLSRLSPKPCALLINHVKHVTFSHLNIKKGTELAPLLASAINTFESAGLQEGKGTTG